jgi:FMN-dependent NADH-azoreductase
MRDESRTDKIARVVLKKLGGEFEEIYLPDENLKPLSKETLNKRTDLILKGDYSNPIFNYAKQFAGAKKIVISAPFWDLSYPSILKIYLENIYVTGIVSEYGKDGKPKGLCRADELIYVTTAGGPYIPDYSYNQIKDMAQNYFGIKNVSLVKAEMLDIDGFDADKIVDDVISNL